jgi:hypothetical protein
VQATQFHRHIIKNEKTKLTSEHYVDELEPNEIALKDAIQPESLIAHDSTKVSSQLI